MTRLEEYLNEDNTIIEETTENVIVVEEEIIEETIEEKIEKYLQD